MTSIRPISELDVEAALYRLRDASAAVARHLWCVDRSNPVQPYLEAALIERAAFAGCKAIIEEYVSARVDAALLAYREIDSFEALRRQGLI